MTPTHALRRRTRLVVPVVAAGLLAAAAPALAVTATCSGTPATCVAGVPVSVVGLGGTRQFSVQDIQGNDLTALNLGTGGLQPFKTHVADTGFTGLAQSFSVSATMTNLYLQQGAGYDYAVRVPSSDLSIGFGSNPLTGSGISLASGTMASCLNLNSTLQAALGLSALGTVLDPSNLALTTLCTLLGVTGGPIATTVDGVAQTVSPTLTSLTDLPVPLSGATGGTFSNPSFDSGTVGFNDPAKTATAATAVPLMSGGPVNLSGGLQSALTTALNNALSGLPLVNATDTGAKTTVAALVAALSGSANALTASLGTVLSGLSLTNQLTVLTGVLTSTSLVPPVLGDLVSIDGLYDGFPVLHATPTTPVPGTYDGTMTVTFVQS
jgi:hypothetical protein